MRNICHNVECRYFQKSENILLRCKILPPPTSTSSSPSSDKKWCAHNLYSLPLPSTLLLDNLSKIIFIFTNLSLYSSEIWSPPASICSEDLSHPEMCSKLQNWPKYDEFTTLHVLTVRQILAISQPGPEYQMGWRGRDAPFCLDLIDSLRWVCKFTFLKKAWSIYNDNVECVCVSAPLKRQKMSTTWVEKMSTPWSNTKLRHWKGTKKELFRF